MTATERALAAAQYANMKGGMNQYTKTATGPANEQMASGLGDPIRTPVSKKQAANKFNTSHKQVGRAKAVLEHGCPELQAAVREELVALSDAEAIVDEDPKVQRQAVAKVMAGEAKTLKAAVNQLRPDPAAEMHAIRRDLDRLVDRMGKAPMSHRIRHEACAGLREVSALIAKA